MCNGRRDCKCRIIIKIGISVDNKENINEINNYNPPKKEKEEIAPKIFDDENFKTKNEK